MYWATVLLCFNILMDFFSIRLWLLESDEKLEAKKKKTWNYSHAGLALISLFPSLPLLHTISTRSTIILRRCGSSLKRVPIVEFTEAHGKLQGWWLKAPVSLQFSKKQLWSAGKGLARSSAHCLPTPMPGLQGQSKSIQKGLKSTL